ncbi:hypothetical protein RhiLY_10297 [Ceratobasidium sp. AG-Ba]|nr:hypothetical protein RhiLY_10297 [Ceratobasidium sp. AG-Ba]
MLTAMTYGELTRGLHSSDLDLHRLSLDSNDSYCYLTESPIIIPAPVMHDLDFFPHRVLVLGGKCTGCLRSRTMPACGCTWGSDCTHASCASRGSGGAAIRRSNTHPRSKNPYSGRRPKHDHNHSKIQRSRSLTDMHALAPSPLRNCAVLDQSTQLHTHTTSHVGPMYESLHGSAVAVPRPGVKHYNTYNGQSIDTPSTARVGYLQTPPTVTTRSIHSPALATPATAFMVTPASASTISPVSPIRSRFGIPMTHAQMLGEARDQDMDDDAKTEVGSPELEQEQVEVGQQQVRLPPMRTLPPPGPVSRDMLQSGAVSRDVLLYGPAGVTPAPAELARANLQDKLPVIASQVPGRQATFFGIQNVPVADGTGRFATMCAPSRPVVPTPTRAVYPPAGIAPLIAGHQGLPHGGLTAPIEREDEVTEWKEMQRAKERADIVVKDGELSVAERVEMEKRVSMSVKVINHIYYGSDDIPKARSPTTTTRRLPDESNEDDNTCPAVNTQREQASQSYWPPTPASMPNSPESPKTRRERQRASMRKDVLGETSRAAVSHSYVVALAYLAGAKPEIHNQLRITADRQHALAIQIAGIPQHVRDVLPDLDWLGSEFTPSPLIDPRRTFLASLVLASKFLLDKAFSNKAWAKLSGLEALEVGKCERALGSALNWRLWVGREASRECVAPAPSQPSYPSPATSTLSMSPPTAFARARTGTWENPTLSSLRGHASPARSSSPISTIYTQNSTPSLTYYTESEPGSDVEGLQGYDEISAWTHQTPELVSEPEDTLHGSSIEHPSATTGSSMRTASEPVVHTRPVLPPFRSFDRPPMRRGPSDLVTPQTDSNMGCEHMPPMCIERTSNESPLAYADFARPWEAMSNQAHWDFTQGGVVSV